MASLPASRDASSGLRSCTLALLTALTFGSGAHAAAPDPFLRSGPVAQPPTLSGPATPGSAAPAPAPVTTAAPVLAGPPVQAFGVPRFSSTGGNTRVVFDLPAGLRYSLTPTFSGLRLDVNAQPGVRVQAQHVPAPGAAVSDYSLTLGSDGSSQLLLQTPFPLGSTQGWTASETTIATGGRVLILNFGAALGGGAEPSVRGTVLAVAPPAMPGSPSATAGAPVPTADQLPPGDTASALGSNALPTPTPALPGSSDSSRLTSGTVPGTPAGPATLGAPRIGKNPGLTRVVLELPPAATFRVTPLPLGLRIDLSGVSAGQLTSAPNLTPEVRGWSVAPNLTGASLTLLTSSPITLRSGWRDVLLPPADGSQLARLAIDVSPALADTSPLGPLALAPLRSARPAMLAFSGTPNRPRVVLDPGHGGSDPGAIGQIVEKEVTLDVARRVRADLAQAGIDVIMTRDSDTALAADKTTDLGMRAALGTTTGAQMFVSIHVNSTEAASALRGYGIETWWNNNHPNSQALAQSIQQDAVASTAAYSRGLKNVHTLAVLRLSRIPAALVEIGYTSHPIDGQNLKDSNYLDRVAFGVASGIRDALQAGIGTTWR
ncbi:N-acetylmuramoyl-L-alanine amidase family protein [Deinococcus aquiradiocola]|uniref:N-acetylmuramoyl-L-alanine amidase n=1 Tax=Deinococcus aquiradiocola TaxID=393059 RepID=A0A917PEF2_9DEIO|nr:N-acetylmuramoyl-L-alanine amidase [Deinococcus aquiradiocola]GGJ72874.1 N-acetylmuramoyl-L-alanine amidase [Deinococcus aquiradiocola]